MASSRGIVALSTAVFGLFIGMGVKHSPAPKSIEAETIVLKGQNGATLVLSCDEGPKIKMVSATGHTTCAMGADGLSLYDGSGNERLQLQGGNEPAVFMKNSSGDVIGAMLTLQDGGAAVGLADCDGDVAALMRGGSAPNMSLFQKSSEPYIAMGVTQSVPHFLVTSKMSQDSLVIHGGETTSLLFVDNRGDVSVFLSKYGLYQGQAEGEKESKKPSKESKVFTWQDLQLPFEGHKLAPR